MSDLNTNTTTTSDDNYLPKKDRSLRFLTIAVIAFFAGVMLCIVCYSVTLLNIYELSKILTISAVIGFLIPLKYYQKWFHFIKYEVIIFNILGMCPFLTGLFLLFNFTFSSNPYTHDYRVEKIYFEGEENYKSIGVILESNIFSQEPKIVKLNDRDSHTIFNKSFLRVTISKGLFGYEVIKDREFIK